MNLKESARQIAPSTTSLSHGPILQNVNVTINGPFPLGKIFRAERNFFLFKDQLAESWCQKTKEIIVPPGGKQSFENERR